MIARTGIAIVAGVLVTFGVLFTMQALIATARRDLDESGTRHFVDFVRAQRDETVQRKERRAEKPAEPEAPPDMPAPRADAVDPADVAVHVGPAPIQAELSISGLGLAVSDGEYLPIVKIAPTYPMRALNRGIEGHVLVEYTVTASGTVKDVVIIESEPPGIFDKASIDAALKFKYKPRVVNGEPIEVAGVRNLFRYRLEQ
jgi:protein TonB